MRIKNMTKYIANQFIKVYGVYACVILFLIIVFKIFSASNGNLGGTEAGSILCLMISAITFYRENIAMSCQNGMSRKSYIISNAAALPITAAVAAVGDTLISIIGNFFETHGGSGFDSFYEETFLMRTAEIRTPTAIQYFETLIFYISMFMAAISVGLLTASIIYRLPKALKVIVPVIFYVIVFIVFPIITAVVANSDPDRRKWIIKLIIKLLNFIGWIYESVGRVSVALIITAAVMFVISSLVIRRTPITDKKE